MKRQLTALFTLVLILLTAVSVAAGPKGGVIRRKAWSFDRSQLDWYPKSKPDEQKAKGSLQGVAGWAEYDFKVSTSGWYELFESGVDPSWPRDIYLDGEMLFPFSHSPHKTRMDDVVRIAGKHLAKEANIWLSSGKHSLRYRRILFPANLPSSWELHPSGNRPEGCIRATSTSHRVLRAGEDIQFIFLGGAAVPLSYELILRNMTGKKLISVAHVKFPAIQAGDKPLKRAVKIKFPREGQFQLIARVGERVLKPSDLKAGLFTVIDTKNPPPAPARLKTTPIIDIDCVAQTINGKPVKAGTNYFENRCRTEVVRRPFGAYRELTPDPTRPAPLGKDVKLSAGEMKKRNIYMKRNWGKWGCEAFAYKFDLPEANQLYRLRVDYPDDDRRTMGFHLQDFPNKRGGWIQGGGVGTGDHYPVSHTMQTHEAYFFCRNPKGLVMPVVNLLPGWKAAAARIRIDRVDEGLPTMTGASRGRAMGFYFEEPGRWTSYFGGDSALPTAFETMERWARWNRYLGSNLLFPTVMCYNGIMWPSRVAQGWGTVASDDTPRMLALVAEKYGQKLVPEAYLSVNIMGLDPKKNRAEFDEVILRSFEGKTKCGWMQSAMNALHPKVQAKYLALIGELADNLKDSPAFAGISSRLMIGWQWGGYNALPGLKYGYEDWTIAQFQKETGIVVPGKAKDPKRFRQRFDYLTGPKREQWLDWRCQKIFDYHKRLRDRIRQARPGTRLFFTWGGDPGRGLLSKDLIGQMREVGMDPKLYEKEPGIVIIHGGMYGRRRSTPTMDAGVIEPALYSPQAKQVARWGDRGYSLYTSYFEYGRAAEFDRLGGKNVFINDCCVPSGVNEREIYAIALADCDSSFIINGGAGWMFGTPSIMQPFLREYRALPAVPFKPWEKARDPVAVWYGKDSGSLFFYAVNRLPVEVEVTLKTGQATKIKSAASGKVYAMKDGGLTFKLEPFMLKSFVTNENTTLTDCRTKVPDKFISKIKPAVAFAKQLSVDLKARRVAPELTVAQTSEAIRRLDEAIAGFAGGEYWKAWRIDSLPLVKFYSAMGKFPPGMWDRSVPHGLGNRKDAPDVTKTRLIIGDVRGRLASCVALDVGPDGKLWAASNNQVMRFGADGAYERNLRLFKPFDPVANLPMPLAELCSLQVLDKNRIGARGWSDPLWSFDAETGRSLTHSIPMRHRAVLLAADRRGCVYVAWNEKDSGVFKFNPDGTPAYDFPGNPPVYRLTKDGARGGGVDKQGRIYLTPLAGGLKVFAPDGKEIESVSGDSKFGALAVNQSGGLVVVVQGMALQAFRRVGDGKLAPAWRTPLKANATAVKFLADDRLVVGFKGEDPDGVVVREFRLSDSGATVGKGLVNGLKAIENRSLAGFTQLKVRKDKVYYLAHGRLWRLTSGAKRGVLAYDPPPGRGAFESFAFAPNGDLYLASHYRGKSRGVNLFRAAKSGKGYGKLEYLNDGKPLVNAWYMVPNDLEVDRNGNVILRLYDPENNPHGHKVSIFRWSPKTGKSKRVLEIGDALGDYGNYGLCQLSDGGLLVAGGTTRSIWRLAPDGKVLWNKTYNNNYIPGTFDVRQPQGITVDSRGRIWVADTARHQIICLDGDGAFVASYGHFGNLDDKTGLGLSSPIGVVVLRNSGGEWLYIADSGNQRIVKWRID